MGSLSRISQLLRPFAGICLAVALIAGCGGGINGDSKSSKQDRHLSFTTQQVQAIELNKPLSSPLALALGEPEKVSKVSHDGVEYVRAEYAASNEKDDRPLWRWAQIESRDGVVSGFCCLSLYPEDSTAFDFASLQFIEPGKTTKASVLQMLGHPMGRTRKPSFITADTQPAPANAVESWSFGTFVRLSPSNDKYKTKLAEIFFDSHDTVVSVATMERDYR